jgi:hypothetical protein
MGEMLQIFPYSIESLSQAKLFLPFKPLKVDSMATVQETERSNPTTIFT